MKGWSHLKHSTHLHTLDLSSNQIEDAGIKILAPALEKQKALHVLNLENNYIRDSLSEQMVVLALGQLKSLRTLNLTANCLREADMQAFIPILKQMAALDTLNLTMTGITPDTFKELKTSLPWLFIYV